MDIIGYAPTIGLPHLQLQEIICMKSYLVKWSEISHNSVIMIVAESLALFTFIPVLE